MLEKLNLIVGGKKSISDNFFSLFGEVDVDKASDVLQWIVSANYSEEPTDMLTMFINSQGGDLNAAWSIIDTMRGSSIPIRVIGLGQISSAGLLILMSGEKGYRILTENTSVMSHQYFWGVIGKHHELMAAQKEFNLAQQRLIKHFKKCTKLSEKKINDVLMPAHDVYLTSEEAKSYGICDIVKSLK